MYIEVGKIVGVWGVKGWVKLHSYTRNREDIAHYSTWYLSKADRGAPLDLSANARVQPVAVKDCRAQGQSIVANLADIDSRDAANELNGLSVLVKQADLPQLAEQEFYWHELIGLRVSNADGELGVIKSIIETGANDVLVLAPSVAVTDTTKSGTEGETKKDSAAEAEILIPYVDSVVLRVELAEQRMFVEWDPSYLQD